MRWDEMITGDGVEAVLVVAWRKGDMVGQVVLVIAKE